MMEPNINFLCCTAATFTVILTESHEAAENLLKYSCKKSDLYKVALRFYALSAKLYNLNNLVWVAMIQPLDSIGALDISHPRWQAIKSIYKRHIIREPEAVTQSYRNFIKNVSAPITGVVATSQ